ncbi:uncharacterized protein MELLADRAFT_110784 [Melampsora larici-populina 98AG31]|uniref:Uncharacterized protein n=1 Tax=Melampsora larici-populina (strain 98AG31 / pathotype 3-4-7) TaxID=747676 RepID=F4S0Y7_MELLP|nr:uncharacterized protein MELLADRAFT_110784 [Melampsora larici-populina 98AG31]EGG01672.1 hypothetical protein MELLADRAFT_110784 [Melampsora larici-populina 98AG31]
MASQTYHQSVLKSDHDQVETIDIQNQNQIKIQQTSPESTSDLTICSPDEFNKTVYKQPSGSFSSSSSELTRFGSKCDLPHLNTNLNGPNVGSSVTMVADLDRYKKNDKKEEGKSDEKAIIKIKDDVKFSKRFYNFCLNFLTWFTPYRQILFLVIFINALIIIAISSGLFGGANRDLSLLVIINIFIAIGIRNEWVIRFIYWIFIKAFRSSRIPVGIRKEIVGILYHIGGLHSGCGVSAMLWLGLSAYQHFKNHKEKAYHPALLSILSMAILCVVMTCIVATPIVRGPRHKFVGCIMSSWITTRQVSVEVFTSSKKATVIKVPGGLTSGVHTRISRGGLKEWHIFGSISLFNFGQLSEGKNADCHYLVAAVQGDFTTSLNLEQPTRLYTKTWKPAGLPYFSRMFNRGVAVCTGSGIGAVASTCIQHSDWFLIWIGPDLKNTYGTVLMGLIETKIPEERRLIWDTRSKLGRPDVFPLLAKTYKEWNAEVVLFIGSPALNQNMLKSSLEAKIPLFGSIWDA